MGTVIVALIKWLIDKWFGFKTKQADTAIEKQKIEVQAEEAKDKVKAVILTSTGAWLFQLFFIVPLAFYWSMLHLYDVFWCADCMYAQPWTIAAMPSPYDQWANAIIAFLFLDYTVAKASR